MRRNVQLLARPPRLSPTLEASILNKNGGMMQTTWKSFTSLDDAIRSTRGNTQISIGLVKENLFIDEQAEWIGTASVNDFGEWKDGSVVLTSQRVFVAYCDPSLQQAYGNMVSRFPVPRISQFQSGGQSANFAIEGLPYQAIQLSQEQFGELNALLADTDITAAGVDATAPAALDPKAALANLKELLADDLITQEEFQAKKKEILDRL